MDIQVLTGLGVAVLCLVVAWNFWQSRRIDSLHRRVGAIEKQ